jgi:spermidine/putrescine transport system permease protein
LFQQEPLWTSFVLTIFIALVSTIISLLIGTITVIGMLRLKFKTQSFILLTANIPILNAEIITAVTLMMVFLSFGIPFGITTLLLAHLSFNIPYVIIILLPKLREIKQEQIESSLDLGATP